MCGSDRITIIWFIITIWTVVRSHNASKRLNNYTLYNKKRHEIYPEIYKLFFETINYANIKNQMIIPSIPIEQFSKEEAEKQIDEIKIPWKKKEELLRLYDSQKRTELNKELSDLRQQEKVINYNKSLNELKWYYMKNQCYISNDIIIRINELLDILDQLYWKYDTEIFYYYHKWSQSEDNNFEEISELSKQANEKLLEMRYCITQNLQKI